MAVLDKVMSRYLQMNEEWPDNNLLETIETMDGDCFESNDEC